MFNPIKYLQKKKQKAPPVNTIYDAKNLSDVIAEAGLCDWTFDDGVFAYKTCPWVYACIDWLQGAASSVEFTVLERKKNKEWEQDLESKIAYCLNNPNKNMSAKNFWGTVVLHLYMCGNALVQKIKTVEGVKLYIIPVGKCKYKLNSDQNEIESYEYTYKVGKDDKTISYKAEDVIHFRFPDPENIFWGQSPLQAVARSIVCDAKILKWWETSITNGCKKDGVFLFKHDLTKEQFAKVRQLLRDQVYGPNNAHTPLVMGHEASFTPFDMTPSELDFLESRKFTREEIASALKVPLILIGGDDRADGKTVEEYREAFWQDTVCPVILDNIISTLNVQLLPDLIPLSKLPKIMISYDTSYISALLPFFAQKIDILLKMIASGWPLNVANRRLETGAPYIDGGDVGYQQGAMMPLGSSHEKFTGDNAGDVQAPDGTIKPPSNVTQQMTKPKVGQ